MKGVRLIENRRRPVVDRVVVDLPFPPSLNGLWRRGTQGVYKSARYRTWLNAAGHEISRQRPGRVPGEYTLTVVLYRPDRRKRDADNYAKAVSDLLVRHGIIEDDSLAHYALPIWSDELGSGCRAVVEAHRQQARAA